MYPVYYIPEVEINPTRWTNTQTIQQCSSFSLHSFLKDFFFLEVRRLIEGLGKTLYFRSSLEPLILDEEGREMRKKTRMEAIKKNNNGNNGGSSVLVNDRTLLPPDLSIQSQRYNNRNQLCSFIITSHLLSFFRSS